MDRPIGRERWFEINREPWTDRRIAGWEAEFGTVQEQVLNILEKNSLFTPWLGPRELVHCE